MNCPQRRNLILMLFTLITLASEWTFADNRKTITLSYFADSHAQLHEHPELFWTEDGNEEIVMAGGFARLYAANEKLRQQNPNGFLFFDAGDTIQGSGEAVLSKGEVMVPLLNSMKLDLAIPGNWEVVYGVEVLKNLTKKLNYPTIAANIFDEQTGALVFEPYRIFERQGLKIAVIGYTDPDVPFRQPPGYSKGFTYKNDAILQPIVDELRQSKKADLIILLSHIGLPKAVELSSRLRNVDLHLSGDTHERTYRPIEKNHWIVEPGAFGSFLGKVDLIVENGKVVDKKWELIELKASSFPEDPEKKKLITKLAAPAKNQLNRIVGFTKEPLYRYSVNQTNLDMLLADAIREATGMQIGLSNGFRFASPVVPGPIRERDLWMFYPINNNLRVGKVTGAQLKEFWEKEIENVYSQDAKKLFGGWLPRPSGMTVRFKVNAPEGQRVTEILVGGVPLKMKEIYTIAACAREGDPENRLCRIPNVMEPKDLRIDAHEALRLYLRSRKKVSAPWDLRVIAEDLPTIVRSQFYRK